MKLIRLAAFLCCVLSVHAVHAQDDATHQTLAPQLGSLTGRFVLDGVPPQPSDSNPFDQITLDAPVSRDNVGRVVPAELAYREYLKKGVRPTTRDDSLLVGKGRGLANVVVYVTSADIPSPVDKTDRAAGVVLKFKNGQFSPRVIALLPTQSLEIKNQDPVNFDINIEMLGNPSVSRRVMSGASELLVVAKPEPFPAALKPQMQSWAKGWLFIHANPYVAVSGANGEFSLPALPPGMWEFCAWHEKCGYLPRWPKGRFVAEIKPEANTLEEVVLPLDAFTGRQAASKGQGEPGVGADSR
jgi:hypothetical protein